MIQIPPPGKNIPDLRLRNQNTDVHLRTFSTLHHQIAKSHKRVETFHQYRDLLFKSVKMNWLSHQ